MIIKYMSYQNNLSLKNEILIRSKINFFWGFISVFPLFFTTSLSVYNGNSLDGIFAIPLSLIVFSVMAPWFFLKSILKRRFFLFNYAFFGSLIFFIFVAISNEVGDYGLYLIYVVPMLTGMLIGLNLRLEHIEYVRSLVNGMVVAATTIAILHLASSINSYGIFNSLSLRGEDSIFTIFSIYQKYIYYPTVLSYSICLAAVYLTGNIRVISISAILMVLFMCAAREAILLAFLFLCYFITTQRLWLRFLMYALPIVALCFFYIASDVGGIDGIRSSVVFAKFSDFEGSSDNSVLTAGRLDAIEYVFSFFDIDFLFLIFGSGFWMNVGELGSPHNQYIEWFLRGGFMYLCFLAPVFLYAIKNLLSSKMVIFNSFAIILIASLLISSNINTPYRAPYSACFLWLLIGIAFNPSVRISR